MRRQILLVAVLFGGGLLTSAAAAAQAAGGAADRWFLHVYTGLGLTEDSDLRLRLPGEELDLVFEDVSWEDHSLSSPSVPYIGVRVGRYLERLPWLGLAVDVVHYKVFAEDDRVFETRGSLNGATIAGPLRMDQIVQRYEIANGVNLYMLTALGRLDRGRWRPYAGFGVGPTVLYTTSTILGESRRGYEFGRLGAQLLAGIELRLGQRFGVFAEVKRTYTEANGSIRGGDSETRLDSNHFVAGGGYRF